MKKTIKNTPSLRSGSTFYVFRSTFYANVLVLVFILALFTACSKFEDGPKISFRSIEKRIYGTYRIEYFSKNGTDLTDYWNQYYDLTFEYFREDESASSYENYVHVKGNIDSLGVWKYYYISYPIGLTKDHEIIVSMDNVIYDTTDYPDRVLYPIITYAYDINRRPRFEITRLTNTEIWMNHSEGSDIYEVHLNEK